MNANARWGAGSAPTANASWNSPAQPRNQNAKWGDMSAPSGGKKILGGMSAFAALAQKYHASGGKRNTAGLASASTSALSNLAALSISEHKQQLHAMAEESDPAMERPVLQLRKETLMSLGIKTKPRGVLKKEGGMRRAATMASIREIEVTLPGHRTIKRNTSITFKQKVSVKKIPSSSSLAENPKELWYQNDEFATIRQKSKALALHADETGVVDDTGLGDKTSIRGLERMMPSNRKEMINRKYDTWDTVLDAQELEYDDERIAQMYRVLSRESLQEAQHRARQDESDVQEYKRSVSAEIIHADQ